MSDDTETTDALEPTPPQTAKKLFHQQRGPEVTEDTARNDAYHVGKFVEWCEETDLYDLTELTGRHVHEYRLWLERDEYSRATVQSILATFRVFLRFCESIDAVTEGLTEKVLLPSRGGATRDEKVDPDTADAILETQARFEYATRDHVIFLLMWRVGLRTGTLHALDVDDYHSGDQYLVIRHRPDEGTTLKNGQHGERLVAVSDRTCIILDDYLDRRRTEATDDHGRRPLLTTRYGRIKRGTIRQVCYCLTRPCTYGDGCPHDREPDSCEATTYDDASKCPSSKSPHTVRRGSITHMLAQGIEQKVVGDRTDVSTDVLEKHYDRTTERQRMEVRRGHLDNI
jgi:site-specific recombinase XerD